MGLTHFLMCSGRSRSYIGFWLYIILTMAAFVLFEYVCIVSKTGIFSEIVKTQPQACCRITISIHLGELVTVL